MDYFVIGIAALLASGLTLFSGFGLGTLLMPVFALFFPIDLAIALTAIVHLLNNLFKLILLGKFADLKTSFVFGGHDRNNQRGSWARFAARRRGGTVFCSELLPHGSYF